MSKLKELRLAKGLTQHDFSKLCGLPESTYSKYESGEFKPNVDRAIRIADALEISNVREIWNKKEKKSGKRKRK